MTNDRPFALLTAGFVAIGVGFVASTVYTELRSRAIDRDVAQLEVNALPSVEHLMAARGELRRLEVALLGFEDTPFTEREKLAERIRDARAALLREVAGETETPDYPGEREYGEAAQRVVSALDRSIDEWMASAPVDGSVERSGLSEQVDRADLALTRWTAVNAVGGRGDILRIQSLRNSAGRLALTLDGVCALLAILAAVIARRALNRQHEAERAQRQTLDERATELEMFAKRVAHDLLSPLTSLSFVLSSIRRAAAKGEPIEALLLRVDACLSRARRLVDGALDFARSGVQAGDGRSDLRGAIEGVIDEARADETDVEDANKLEIVVEPFADTLVRCPPGVLSSILSNLVGNAVKYTRDRDVRRVTLRVLANGTRARVEVEDTGPGLPAGYERAVFEPYVRAPDAKPGLGLGLATVRRFVEAHGGKVGVESAPERGSVFWFELQKTPQAREGGEPKNQNGKPHG